jgi:hypothetical protein
LWEWGISFWDRGYGKWVQLHMREQ